MDPITITLDADLIREALIALRDRHAELTLEHQDTPYYTVQAICERQLTRVEAAIAALALAVGEG